ncbi:hypothetical protein FQA39_LY02142 [Lamprigera yunnana]|nr:hypothetical protein FQA39_LY02142 [Lamprigera yunnana]
MTNLLQLSSDELQKFLKSVDNFVLDVDGVVWSLVQQPLEGVRETLKKLRKLQKKVCFVSNNSLYGLQQLYNNLLELDPNLDITDVITPCVVIIAYLKSIDFNKTIFLIGTQYMKQDFVNAGFKVTNFVGSVESFLNGVDEVDGTDDVGAVIFDNDLNTTLLQLSKAFNYIANKDILYISNVMQNIMKINNQWVVGIGILQDRFQQILDIERKPMFFGKPGKHMQNYVKEKLNCSEGCKTVLIGDMLDLDIVFGKKCGFKTTLVLSGFTKNCDFKSLPEDKAPDYYLPSLGDMCSLFEEKLNI